VIEIRSSCRRLPAIDRVVAKQMSSERRLYPIVEKLICWLEIPAQYSPKGHSKVMEHRIRQPAGITKFGFGGIYTEVRQGALFD
jgi:hypothetical protein